MARIFITGSADGLGQLAAKALISQGHAVVLHARNAQRSQEALAKNPGAEDVLTADLSNMDETKELAARVNALGSFDAIIHNAGVYQAPGEVIFSVNTLAPYILTSLIQKPKRLVYLSSGMHRQGRADAGKNRYTYSDSKLHDLMLSMAVCRCWPDVYANAVDPGWVPTKMGGNAAPDDLDKGYETQVWLAASNDQQALVSGRYFHHKKEDHYLPEANDVKLQEKLLAICALETGVDFPITTIRDL
ncbi:MAG: daunorubicin ketoreductase [Ferruginibacter sp.]|nr:daunorubicin ketoreductase [Ferruginibacter sp.]